MVCDSFRTSGHMSQAHGYADLSAILEMGDNAADAQKLLGCWDHVPDDLEEGLSEKVHRDRLLADEAKDEETHGDAVVEMGGDGTTAEGRGSFPDND